MTKFSDKFMNLAHILSYFNSALNATSFVPTSSFLTWKSLLFRAIIAIVLSVKSRVKNDNNFAVMYFAFNPLPFSLSLFFFLSLSLNIDTLSTPMSFIAFIASEVSITRGAKQVTAMSTFAFPSNVDLIPFRCLSATAKAFAVCEKFSDQLSRTVIYSHCFLKMKKY